MHLPDYSVIISLARTLDMKVINSYPGNEKDHLHIYIITYIHSL